MPAARPPRPRCGLGPGAVRSHDVAGAAGGAAGFDCDLVIAQGQVDGDGDQLAHPGAPVHFHRTVLRQVVESGFELLAAAVLAGDGEARGLAQQVADGTQSGSSMERRSAPATTAGGSSRSHSRRARPASERSSDSVLSVATPRAPRMERLASALVTCDGRRCPRTPRRFQTRRRRGRGAARSCRKACRG